MFDEAIALLKVLLAAWDYTLVAEWIVKFACAGRTRHGRNVFEFTW